MQKVSFVSFVFYLWGSFIQGNSDIYQVCKENKVITEENYIELKQIYIVLYQLIYPKYFEFTK